MRCVFTLLVLAGLCNGDGSSMLVQPHRAPRQNLRGKGLSQPNLAAQPIFARSHPICERLINRDTHFDIEVEVGTPPQKFELVADTGSGALIVQSCLCRKYSADCKESEDCFLGTNRSSTFVGPKRNTSLKLLSFGSGDIVAAVATDVVRIGSSEKTKARATMKEGLLLMIDRELRMLGHFEGILGLGVPSWIMSAKAPPEIEGAEDVKEIKSKHHENHGKNKSDMGLDPFPRFMEEAGVGRFSICYNDNGKDGALKMNAPAAPKMLKQVGYRHWSLHFQGFSVGSATEPVTFCDPSQKEDHQHIACAGIPDSGTTLMLGPPDQVDELYAELCRQWPRCHDSAAGEEGRKSQFLWLLNSCSEWIDETGIGEMPSIFVHVAGADGETDVLKLTSWAYVTQALDVDGQMYCEALFGKFNFETALHGHVWILGTPLFYQYQVVFSSKPAAIGFSETDCMTCEEEAQIEEVQHNSTLEVDEDVEKALAHARLSQSDKAFRRGGRVPRVMRGTPRMPSIDPTLPI